MTARPRRPAATTTVSSRYQTVIPAEVRRQFLIREGTRISWVVAGDAIRVIPLPDEPWAEFRGAGRGGDLLQSLMDYRAKERTEAGQSEARDRDATDRR